MHDLSLKELRMCLQVLALILKPALPQFVTARCVAFSVSLAFLASRNAARDPTKSLETWVNMGPKHVFLAFSDATSLLQRA